MSRAEEIRAIDRKYCVKSEHEEFERNVLECDLNEAAVQKSNIYLLRPLRRSGDH